MKGNSIGDMSPDDNNPIDDESGSSFQLYADDMEGQYQHIPDADNVTPAVNDEYIGMQVNMPIGGEIRSAKVKRRLLDDSGNPTGVAHVNPLLDT